MPRGKFTNHKGRSRRFTNPDELEEERRKEEQKKNWRQQHGDETSSEEEAEKKISEESGSEGSGSEEEESSSEEEGTGKAKGVSNLIEIENPNRVQKKMKKVTKLDTDEKPELSRREREEIEKRKARAQYRKLHAEGKTHQARADLARLAIIRQQRDEAKKRREAEIKEREDAAKAKSEATQKALGKK